jgi:hypothetical protein
MIIKILCVLMLLISFNSIASSENIQGTYEHFCSLKKLPEGFSIDGAVKGYETGRGSYQDFVISALHDEDSDSSAAYNLAAYIWSSATWDGIKIDFEENKLSATTELLARLMGLKPTSEFTDEIRGFGELLGNAILKILNTDYDDSEADYEKRRIEKNREAINNLLITQIKIAPRADASSHTA